MTPRLYPVEITGKTLTLRELLPADDTALYQVYGDDSVTQSLSFTSRTLPQIRNLIAAAATDAARDPRTVYMLAVADAAGELVGAARLGIGEYESAMIGFALRPDQWGSGRGTETARLLQQLGFTGLGLHRLWGARDPLNVVSGRTMDSAGMPEEGRIRGHLRRHGQWRDSIVHSILAEEYQP
jgi:[ribosomal protein S5]-alanine N-acetyltransferase